MKNVMVVIIKAETEEQQCKQKRKHSKAFLSTKLSMWIQRRFEMWVLHFSLNQNPTS